MTLRRCWIAGIGLLGCGPQIAVSERPCRQDEDCDATQTCVMGSADDEEGVCEDNLEFRLHRRIGYPMASGAAIFVDCELSQNGAIDCPALP